MLIDDIIADAKDYTRDHVEIFHRLLPDKDVEILYLEYIYEQIDEHGILAELYWEDKDLGTYKQENLGIKYPSAADIISGNAAAKILTKMMDYREELL